MSPTSGSVAVAVKVSVLCSTTLWVPMVARTGASFVLVTVMVTVSLSESAGTPLSVTTTSKVCTPTSAFVVGQEKDPVRGSMTAPEGAPVREKVSRFAGSSESLATAVKLTVVRSATVWSPIGASTGGWLTSLTVTVMVSVSNRVVVSVATTSKV